MQILLGIVLILGGAAGGFFMFKRFEAAAMEMQYMQTSSVSEAIDLMESMLSTDPSYRHYVELKGVINSEEPVTAPFSGRQAAFYSNQCYSVNEETQTKRDSQGNTRTEIVKKENQISSEKSPVPTFLKDPSSETPVYIDMDSFGGAVELQPGCDRFEAHNSSWLQQNHHYVSRWNYYPQARFLGYRLKEQLLAANQPIYALGELYASGGRYYIGKSYVDKKHSKLTYKSEDQLVNDTKNKKWLAIAIGAGCIAIGIFMIISGL